MTDLEIESNGKTSGNGTKTGTVTQNKVKFTLEHTTKAQRGRRSIALLFL
jgi:hypothetical protein